MPAAFWLLTPREFDRFLRGRAKAARENFAQGMALAWHGAVFQRAKTIPELKPLIDRIVEKPAPPKTPADLLRIVEGINFALGGRDLRNRRKGA